MLKQNTIMIMPIRRWHSNLRAICHNRAEEPWQRRYHSQYSKDEMLRLLWKQSFWEVPKLYLILPGKFSSTCLALVTLLSRACITPVLISHHSCLAQSVALFPDSLVSPNLLLCSQSGSKAPFAPLVQTLRLHKRHNNEYSQWTGDLQRSGSPQGNLFEHVEPFFENIEDAYHQWSSFPSFFDREQGKSQQNKEDKNNEKRGFPSVPERTHRIGIHHLPLLSLSSRQSSKLAPQYFNRNSALLHTKWKH